MGPLGSSNCTNNKMVASSDSLEELGVSHPANASGDRGVCIGIGVGSGGVGENNRSAQTALDKRSRLSNVINNLRKKVPDSKPPVQQQLEQQPQHQQQKKQNNIENDGRNSVERNLENLEKYVMTVLNGVIKDEAVPPPSEDNPASFSSAAKDPLTQGLTSEVKTRAIEESRNPAADKNADEAMEGAKNSVEEAVATAAAPTENLEKSNNWLDKKRENIDVCRELMSDLLNDINQLIEGKPRDLEPTISDSSPTSLHCSLPLDKVGPILRSCAQDGQPSTPSPQRSPSRPSPPTVRHLCLYCDRKFLSISLRQRHTERVHQVAGGSRRSERNSRRSLQTCQYCSERVNEPGNEHASESPEPANESLDSLDGLFRHMARNHSDRYYACVLCSTRYSTRENLTNHAADIHGSNTLEDPSVEPKIEEPTEPKKDVVAVANPGSPAEFDSSFYSSVSCNIRENLLHHLDGKLQSNSPVAVAPVADTNNKPVQPQQNFYESNAAQIQLPIDISLTAATPVYNKIEYSTDGTENSSEYAQRPGKTRIHPRRVSFEKYNFPRKYDGKEPWSCSIKDLSKFDISTQLTLRKKQQITKPIVNTTSLINRLCNNGGSNEQINSGSNIRQTDIAVGTSTTGEETALGDVRDPLGNATLPSEDSSSPNNSRCSDINVNEIPATSNSTVFTSEFASFMRLKRWDEVVRSNPDHREIVYAELTGEWSRPRIYVCGACADKHVSFSFHVSKYFMIIKETDSSCNYYIDKISRKLVPRVIKKKRL